MNRRGPSHPPPSRRHPTTAVVVGGAVYFLLVFGVGFVLGVVRTLWLVPRIGVRWAELLEVPVMLAVIYWAARWVSRWFRLDDHRRPVQAGVGFVGLLLLVGAELGLALQLGGQSPGEYVAGRDPVSGTAYGLSLVLFVLMPALVTRDPDLTSADGKRSQRASEYPTPRSTVYLGDRIEKALFSRNQRPRTEGERLPDTERRPPAHDPPSELTRTT